MTIKKYSKCCAAEHFFIRWMQLHMADAFREHDLHEYCRTRRQNGFSARAGLAEVAACRFASPTIYNHVSLNFNRKQLCFMFVYNFHSAIHMLNTDYDYICSGLFILLLEYMRDQIECSIWMIVSTAARRLRE